MKTVHMGIAMRVATLVCAIASLSCTSQETSGDPPVANEVRREVLAPIEAAELVVRESFPPHYAVRITSGLPSGCARFDRIDVERASNVFTVTVWNTLPVGQDIACTMIYGTTQNTAELGDDLASGQSYDVRINGIVSITLVAQ